ncbi:MAG: hypothetical protein KatS3mg006_0321 [Pyrinomonadaceae bacterium]|nr:MAG: hypothetical protein KatS3mg006_0321 [Pyrinomonadaceae bacterium]
MRYLYFAILSIILISHSQSLFAQKLQLTGKISNLKMTETPKTVEFSYDVELTFTNIGNVPILLLKSDFLLLCIDREIYGIPANEKDERKLWSFSTFPSIGVTPDWRNIKKTLDAKAPPSSIIKRVNVGESIVFYGKEWFYFNKEKDKYFKPENFTWNEIKDAKSLSLRLTYRIWSLDFETSSPREEKKFGKKLQKRWRKYGYLWLDDIVSEPVPLDLSSVVIKTDSQP